MKDRKLLLFLILVVFVLALAAYLLNEFPLRNVLMIITFLVMVLFMFRACYKDIVETDERKRVQEQRHTARYRYKLSSSVRICEVKYALYEMAKIAEEIENLETLLADVQVAEQSGTCGKEVIATYRRNCGTAMNVNLNIDGNNMTAMLMEETIGQELVQKRASLLNKWLALSDHAITQTITETVTETEMIPKRGRVHSNVFERLF